MSAATKQALEEALVNHLRDEGDLQQGELVTEWLVLSCAIPAEWTEERKSIIFVTSASGMVDHHAKGLAHSYLYDLEPEEP